MENVLPYVYRVTNKKTGAFYIGARFANTVPSFIDIGVEYFTSSDSLKQDFKKNTYNYLVEVVLERECADAVHVLEQALIHQNISNPKIINRSCIVNGDRRFRNEGGYSLTDETKNKMKKPKSQDAKLNMKLAQIKRRHEHRRGYKLSSEAKANMSVAQKNKAVESPITEDTKRKISKTIKELGIRPISIQCSCSLCRRLLGINTIKKHFLACKRTSEEKKNRVINQ
jgi:hypothetical protein